LGSHQRASSDPRRDRNCDADAVDRRRAFTERDWLFLFGHPREKVLSLHLWLRFTVLWVVVVLMRFVEGYVLLPFGLAAFLGAVFLAAHVVWHASKWLRPENLSIAMTKGRKIDLMAQFF
jgi:hypothetical protein